MTDDFVVQLIASLQTIDDLTLLVISHAGNHCNGLVHVGIEVGIVGLNLLDA